MLTECPACLSEAIYDTNRARDLALWRCLTCDHIFQNPQTISAVYDSKYAGKYDAYATLQQVAFLRLGFLKGFIQNGRLLDVGYGNGAFVKAATAAGFNAFGSDIHGADYGVREIDLATDTSSWDVVTFFDSMEHFQNLEILKKLAARSKMVLISIPCRPANFPVELEEWRHYRPGEHLHYFSDDSLSAVVRKRVLWRSNVEDAIRSNPRETQNIKTVIFGE